jgi:hypothetical protein
VRRWWLRAATQSAGGEAVRWRFAGVTRKRVLSLGFERGLHWEVAGGTGNSSSGSGGGGSDRRWRPAVRGGSRRRRGRVCTRRQGKRGKSDWRASLPHCGAPAVACGGEEAAERRRDGRPKLGYRVFRTEGGGCGLGGRVRARV